MINRETTKSKIPQTGIEDIDKQYQKIQAIIIDLDHGINSNCIQQNIPKIFYGLMHLHSHYFVQEQITLAKYKYKDLCELKTYHKEFLDDVLLYREKVAKEPNSFCTEMKIFLIEWSKKYFLKNLKAIEFLKSKGVK